MTGTLGESGATRVLVVVAHPDDETFGTGSLLLHLADVGVTTAVCCASRGEAGDIRQDVAVPPGGIGSLREAELRDAATLLGVREVFVLDLLDSGMAGTAPPGSIIGEPLPEVKRRLTDVAADFHPDLIVTLDGSDGHRDHARVRDVAVTVAGELGIPAWLHCLPRRLMRGWAEQMAGEDRASPYLALAELGTPDELITERIDTTEHYDRRRRAIALHRSQVSPYEGLPEDLRRAFLTAEHLRPAAARARASDPDRLRHQHHRATCYWDLVECRWVCQRALPPTGAHAGGHVPAE